MNNKVAIQEEIIAIIDNSLLENDEKKKFVDFLGNVDEKDLKSMKQVFKNDPGEVVVFWKTLEVKKIFLRIIESNANFSEKEKSEIKRQIAGMNEGELAVCIENAKKTGSQDELKAEVERLSEEHKKAHNDFIASAEEFLKNDLKNTIETQRKEDDENYKKILQKLNS